MRNMLIYGYQICPHVRRRQRPAGRAVPKPRLSLLLFPPEGDGAIPDVPTFVPMLLQSRKKNPNPVVSELGGTDPSP